MHTSDPFSSLPYNSDPPGRTRDPLRLAQRPRHRSWRGRFLEQRCQAPPYTEHVINSACLLLLRISAHLHTQCALSLHHCKVAHVACVVTSPSPPASSASALLTTCAPHSRGSLRRARPVSLMTTHLVHRRALRTCSSEYVGWAGGAMVVCGCASQCQGCVGVAILKPGPSHELPSCGARCSR